MEEKRMNYCLYIGAAVVILGIILMLIGFITTRNKHQAEEVKQDITQTEVYADSNVEPEQQETIPEKQSVLEETVPEETPKESDISDDPEIKINELIQNYYTAYTSGDTDAVEEFAAPVSELEKSYIKLMSNYTKSMEHIQCFINKGMKEGEYTVSVVADMVLDEIDVAAPGLDFFYVRTNNEGIYYIDNAYCSFNTSVHVMDTDSELLSFIADYESQDEFKALQDDVQNRYNEILASNQGLKHKLSTEIPQAVNQWMTTLGTTDQSKTKDTNNIIPGKSITVHDNYNIRSSMKEAAKKIGNTKEGDTLSIIKNYPNGWTKVKWKKEIGYIKTKLLIENQN